MKNNLQGKCAIITGGSRGIGRAIAIELATQGAHVVFGYQKNEASADEVVKTIADLGGKANAIKHDISVVSEASEIYSIAEQIVGKPDIVVANAASIIVKPLMECSEEDYNRIFNINTRGVFFVLREAARRIRDNGRIIVISTGGTKLFFPDQSLYLGSKGAVEQFVRCLAWELANRSVTVNAISPGPTETDMMQERYRDEAASKSPFNRIGRPEEIADIVAYLVSDGAQWVTGQNILAGGGAF
jgi:3-oxoacyl-[acyl-carrier protein] reductase